MKDWALLFVLVIVLVGALGYLALSSLKPNASQLSSSPGWDYNSAGAAATTSAAISAPPQCISGESRNCSKSNGCSGVSVCSGGVWSSCFSKVVCSPGRIVPCEYDSCNFGLRTCDACGDGWGECKLSGGQA